MNRSVKTKSKVKPKNKRPAQPANTAAPNSRSKTSAGPRPAVATTVAPTGGRTSVDKNASAETGDRNVDQIRDILFGGQMREYERRLQEMMQRFDQESLRLREDFERRAVAIERRLDESVDRLGKLVRQESSDRAQSLDDLESRLQQAARTARGEVNTALAGLQQEIHSADERLRAAVGQLDVALHQAGDSANAMLVATRDELRGEKVSRDDLAALLTEVAMRLQGSFDLPTPR